jgi:hypothetical protein
MRVRPLANRWKPPSFTTVTVALPGGNVNAGGDKTVVQFE